MILKRLRIDRLPGIADGFELTDLAAGLNIVLGPNASGKSSLCRAVRGLLYCEPLDGSVSLEAEFEDLEGPLRVVRQGRDVHWERQGRKIDPPPLPDERMKGCFTIHLEDLLSDGDTEQAIGERIGKILAGGYDLDAVRESERFRSRQRHGRKESAELRTAEAHAEAARRRQLDLRDEEQQLDELRTRKEEAVHATSRIEPLKTARELLRHRRELGTVEIELSEFPAAMDKLVGDERDRLGTLRPRLERQNETLGNLREKSSDARRQLELAGLDGDEPTEAALAERRSLLNDLRLIEQQRDTLDGRLTHARSRRADALNELGGKLPAPETRIGPEAVSRAEDGLASKRTFDAQIGAIEEQLALLGADETDDATFERIRRARTALSDWLASPDWTAVQRRVLWPWVVLILLISLGVIGVAAWFMHWTIALAALPVLAAGSYLLLPAPPPTDRRGDARSAYTGTGLDEPDGWEEEAVRRRLASLEAEIAAGERSRVEAEQRKGLERQLDRKRDEANEITDDLRSLADEVGFAPEKLDGSFDRWLRLTKKYDDAGRDVVQLEADRKGLTVQEGQIRADLTDFLASFDEAPDDPGTDRIGDRLDRLETRRKQRDDARQTLSRAQRDRETALEEIERTSEEIAGVYSGAGLPADDDAELTRRLDLRKSWLKACDRRRDTRAVLKDTERRLGEEPQLVTLVETDDEDALLRQLEAAETLAGEQEDISKTITTIENAARSARAGHELEDARARVAKCEEELRARHYEEGFAEVARFLLSDVELEHADSSRPAVLRDAESWFARFTRNAFELRSSGRRGGSFLVRETATGENRTPGQLSSGTRMQLFLGLRLAFALDAERGRESLPFFLDEALTITDPDRFRSVVDCLDAFARDRGRQLFYLTAQPHDLLEWEALKSAPKQIRLHEVRRLTSAIRDPSGLEPPRMDEVPSCEGKTAEEYGVLLQVPRVELWDVAESVQLFHLLRDRLPLLARLLEFGIRNVGSLRSLLDSEAAELLLSPAEREELRWRNSVVETFLVACRRGRGRPLDREVLVDADVSPTFLPRLSPLVDELNGSASALLDAIDTKQDERVKGFRTRQREELQTYFEDHGYIDTRDPLEIQQITQHLLSAAADEIKSGTTTAAKVAELTRFLLATALTD